MKNSILITIAAILLTACSVQEPLYTWGNYANSSYNYLKNSDDKSSQELIKSYKTD